MGLKKSVMLSDNTLDYISSRHRDADGEPRWSAAVNGAVDTLRAIYRSSVPDLNEKAWNLLLNAHAGHFFDWRPISPMRLASDIMDDLGVISIESLTEGDAEAVRTIHGLSQIEQLAVFEVIRIFWAGERTEETLMGMIAACKLKL
ncbi:hypothetical protein [Aeromonas veronii]|uniref:hypothetical protein n=1 Tax=Aeromonas veronii TaxID=654 RepID=UPI0038B6AFA8